MLGHETNLPVDLMFPICGGVEGDFVLRFYAPNLKSKLDSPYIGRLRIIVRLGEVNYKIKGPHPQNL